MKLLVDMYNRIKGYQKGCSLNRDAILNNLGDAIKEVEKQLKENELNIRERELDIRERELNLKQVKPGPTREKIKASDPDVDPDENEIKASSPEMPSTIQKLKKFRLENNITLAELSKLLNINFTTLSHWENSYSIPRNMNLYKVEKFLKEMEVKKAG